MRQRRTRQEWQALLDEQPRSGLSIQRFTEMADKVPLKIIDRPHQPLLDGWQDDASADEPPVTPTEVRGHTRQSRKQRSGQKVNDSGLRFDESVPQKIIELPAPERTSANAEPFEIIDYKAVYHLPLYRQHQRLLDSGIRVSRSTLITSRPCTRLSVSCAMAPAMRPPSWSIDSNTVNQSSMIFLAGCMINVSA